MRGKGLGSPCLERLTYPHTSWAFVSMFNTYRGHIGVNFGTMEKKVETTILLYRGYIGVNIGMKRIDCASQGFL